MKTIYKILIVCAVLIAVILLFMLIFRGGSNTMKPVTSGKDPLNNADWESRDRNYSSLVEANKTSDKIMNSIENKYGIVKMSIKLKKLEEQNNPGLNNEIENLKSHIKDAKDKAFEELQNHTGMKEINEKKKRLVDDQTTLDKKNMYYISPEYKKNLDGVSQIKMSEFNTTSKLSKLITSAKKLAHEKGYKKNPIYNYKKREYVTDDQEVEIDVSAFNSNTLFQSDCKVAIQTHLTASGYTTIDFGLVGRYELIDNFAEWLANKFESEYSKIPSDFKDDKGKDPPALVMDLGTVKYSFVPNPETDTEIDIALRKELMKARLRTIREQDQMINWLVDVSFNKEMTNYYVQRNAALSSIYAILSKGGFVQWLGVERNKDEDDEKFTAKYADTTEFLKSNSNSFKQFINIFDQVGGRLPLLLRKVTTDQAKEYVLFLLNKYMAYGSKQYLNRFPDYDVTYVYLPGQKKSVMSQKKYSPENPLFTELTNDLITSMDKVYDATIGILQTGELVNVMQNIIQSPLIGLMSIKDSKNLNNVSIGSVYSYGEKQFDNAVNIYTNDFGEGPLKELIDKSFQIPDEKKAVAALCGDFAARATGPGYERSMWKENDDHLYLPDTVAGATKFPGFYQIYKKDDKKPNVKLAKDCLDPEGKKWEKKALLAYCNKTGYENGTIKVNNPYSYYKDGKVDINNLDVDRWVKDRDMICANKPAPKPAGDYLAGRLDALENSNCEDSFKESCEKCLNDNKPSTANEYKKMCAPNFKAPCKRCL